MSVDIPNAYIQADVPVAKEGQEQITMKITGLLVVWLAEIELETCQVRGNGERY